MITTNEAAMLSKKYYEGDEGERERVAAELEKQRVWEEKQSEHEAQLRLQAGLSKRNERRLGTKAHIRLGSYKFKSR